MEDSKEEPSEDPLGLTKVDSQVLASESNQQYHGSSSDEDPQFTFDPFSAEMLQNIAKVASATESDGVVLDSIGTSLMSKQSSQITEERINK